MIEIRELPNGSPLIISSVSDFADSMGYCEFRIKHFLRGIKPPQTQVTIEGAQSHQKEVEYEKARIKFEPITQEVLDDIERDMEFPREGLYTRLSIRMNFGKQKLSLLMIGQADKIARGKEMLLVEESKYPNNIEKYSNVFEPYEDHKLQVLVYLNSLFTPNPDSAPKQWIRIPHKEKVWIINIKDKRTGKSVKIFKAVQNKEAEDYLREKLTRFALIVLGILEPEHHKSVNKCQSCRLSATCEYRIGSS
jgi:hypothetical protein